MMKSIFITFDIKKNISQQIRTEKWFWQARRDLDTIHS